MLEKIKRFICNPKDRFSYLNEIGFYNKTSDERYLKKIFKIMMGKELNLESPQSYNEKLQWLKLYDQKELYTTLVDKYKVREYVSKKIGNEFLIPLLGVWDHVDDIPFELLPNQFVLKCNHNSGLGMYICTDKSLMDMELVKKNLEKGLKQDYYMTRREWPYKNVPRKIICEKFMTDDLNNGLKDYKFYCFNGVVKLLGIYTDRNSKSPTKADYFDRDYNWINMEWGYQHSEIIPEKPLLFNEMVSIAEKLSEGFIEIRVDLYLCGDKIYFGELTFFDGSGLDSISPYEWDLQLGKWIKLPKSKIIENK